MVNKRKDLLKKIFAKVAIYFVLLLMYAPLIFITIYSFSKSEASGVWTGFSLDNFKNLFNPKNIIAKEIWNAAKNTILVAVTASLLSTIIGTFGAIGINSIRNRHLKNTMNFVTQIPIVNAEIVTGVCLYILFLFILSKMNLPLNFFTLVIGHTVLTIPYVVISVLPKLEQMDPSLYEAALDLGATRTQALWKVVIPETIPGILSGFMLSITLSLDDFVITEFTKPDSNTSNFHTISTYVDSKTKKPLPPQLRAFTAVIFAVILLVMIGMFIKTSHDNKKQKMISSKGEIL